MTGDPSSTRAAERHRFYGELARLWPLLSPVADYADEAAECARLLALAAPGATTVLELGSGGGHVAFHMKQRFTMTLSDLSADMLAVSRRLNPECEHVEGDMRSLDLGRTFDAVFVHDAVDYMVSEADLAAALATAFRHCRPGGAAVVVPDALEETFEPGTDCGGSDGDGEGVRYLEWSYDPDPDDHRVTTVYTFVVRSSDGSITSFSEAHVSGCFARETWLRLLAEAGFEPEAVFERTEDERTPRTIFIGRRPPSA